MDKNYIYETIHSAGDRTPYTYLIGWSKLNIWYYGVRFAKGCHPSDLWIKYFTSSRIVKRFVLDNGPPDMISIDRVFNSIDDARLYEHRELTNLNAITRNDFLNKSSGLGIPPMPGYLNPFFGKTHSKETRIKISKANKGRIHTDEFCKKISEKLSGINHPFYGKKHNDETIEKMRKIKFGKKNPTISISEINPEAYKILTNKQILLEYKNLGKSSNFIAKELGVNSTTVRRYAAQYNIEFNSKTETPISEAVVAKLTDKNYLFTHIENGKTAIDVATDLGISQTSVLRYAKLIGVTFPRKPKNMDISNSSMIKLSDPQFFSECKANKLTFTDISKILGDVSAAYVGKKYRKLFNTRY